MATQESRAQVINSGTVDGMVAFCDYLIEKGYATSGAVTPWKSAAKQVFEAVEGPQYGEFDVRGLDLDDYFSRWENMERGNYKAESLQSYRSRLRRAHEAYLAYLDNGATPQLGRRAPRRKEAEERPGAEGSLAPTRSDGRGGGPAVPVADLVDYPFPLQSGQLAYVRLPRKLERSDAERLAAFVRTLVFEAQGQLPPGKTEHESDS
jgi:hypothetical protein